MRKSEKGNSLTQMDGKTQPSGGTFAKAQKLTHNPKFCKRATKPTLDKNRQEMTTKQTTGKEGRRHNITYTQAGVWCFVEQESAKIKVQFFVGSSVVKIPACV